MNEAVLPYLRCPVCQAGLAAVATVNPRPPQPVAPGVRALRCPRGHSFDLARQGYVNLLAGHASHPGDSAEMVGARDEFLGAGHYAFLEAALAEAARSQAARSAAARSAAARSQAVRNETGPAEGRAPGAYPDLVVDAGAGTGRYLAAVLDALPSAVGLALDVAKPALRRAARAHPRASAVLADTWRRLPLPDGAATLLLNVFAPRNGPEFRRVLRRDGALLVVTPTPDHLAGLVGGLGLLRIDPHKADRLADSLAGHFGLTGRTTHGGTLRLSRREVRTLVGMGPSAWHADPARLDERVQALPEPVTVTASVDLSIYRPR